MDTQVNVGKLFRAITVEDFFHVVQRLGEFNSSWSIDSRYHQGRNMNGNRIWRHLEILN